MYGFFSLDFSFPSEHKRFLRDLTIREDAPGSILRDFEALLGYFREGDLPITGTLQLPNRVLPEINARLTHPLQLRLKRPRQKSYPHIQGLYLLARASGLTCVGGTGKKPLLSVDHAVYSVWEHLNPTERYGTLLESWLLRGRPEIVGEPGSRLFSVSENFTDWLRFSSGIPDEGVQIAGDNDAENRLRYIPGWHPLALLELFGLIGVQHGSPEPGKGWRIERIDRTRLGDALLALLLPEFLGDSGGIFELDELEDHAPVGVLQPVFQPYFPEWRNSLSLPEETFREGTHIFKVSLGGIWFRIAVSGDEVLDALAYAILRAVEFDHDHLYMFSYRNRFGALEEVHHPYMDEGPWTNEVRVGDVPLRVGGTMIYLFDFGDNWKFDVTLEQVDTDRIVKKPVVLEAHGEPPEQYPGWDDGE